MQCKFCLDLQTIPKFKFCAFTDKLTDFVYCREKCHDKSGNDGPKNLFVREVVYIEVNGRYFIETRSENIGTVDFQLYL